MDSRYLQKHELELTDATNHVIHELCSASTSCSSGSKTGTFKLDVDSSPNSPFASQSELNSSSLPSNSQEQRSSSETDSPCSQMRHVLQELGSVLMGPDGNEAGTSRGSGDLEAGKPIPRPKQRSRTWKHDALEEATVGGLDRADQPAEKRQKETREGQDVKNLLSRCAEAVHDGRIVEFEALVKETGNCISINGDPIQRLGAYMLEGLVARHEASGPNIYRALRCQRPENGELLSYMRILYDNCPYFKFGYMAANGAIAEALKNEDRIHIVDFQIAQGTQWVTLIQALAARPGGPPRVRITGIHDPVSEYAPGDGLQLVRNMFSEMSKQFNIPVDFIGLQEFGPQVTKGMLRIQPGEALAVNFNLQLHHTPDESVDVNNPRDGLLRMVKGLSPRVVTIVEQESNTNTTPFLVRFAETWDYYSAMFESIDVTLPRESKQRINVEQHCLAKDIVNVIACEGKERIERHELLGKWRSRLTMAGFRPCPLSPYVNSVIRTLLSFYSRNYTLIEKDGAMLLGWKNRSLISTSAWE
ncbi:hypothetical protein HPP92_000734 [Vanilla planifolia]|uniref:Uncharacterized protein n=1 Tax=Vanilla planifolia TaxID=51239 RepID=A0A835VJ19_VANPL|nr:hypothetical protein HPP92_000734 [Vanilla planifolia]